MPRAPSRAVVPAVLALVAAVALALACGSPLGPPPAQIANFVDTVTLYSVSDTPVTGPSAFDIINNERVITPQVSTFDFLFAGDTAVHFRADGAGPQLVPAGAIPSLVRGPAFQRSSLAFDSITSAPGGGWNDSTGIAVDSGNVLIARSRPTDINSCPYGAIVYEYAKIEVLTVDTAAGTIRLKMLVNVNCGYRDLLPGIPKH